MAVRVSAAFYTLPLIIAAMVAAGIAAWALYYRTRGAYSFAAMMGAISWWLCAYTLELTSSQLADALPISPSPPVHPCGCTLRSSTVATNAPSAFPPALV